MPPETRTDTTHASSANANLDANPTAALERTLIVVALAMGAILGFAGNFVAGATQDTSYALSSMGLIAGSALLTLRNLDGGHRLRAAGFLVLALGEAVVMTAGSATDPGSLAVFTAGVTLYVPALLLVALDGGLPTWVRGITALAAVPFAAHVALFHAGSSPSAQGPAAGLGYMLLILAIVGWVWSLYRGAPSVGAADGIEA